MGSRRWYRVRVREKLGPKKWIKKTKMYFEKGPAEARSKYKGNGHVMYVEKTNEYKIWGMGDFFSMGPRLMKELRRENEEKLRAQGNLNNERGYHGRTREETTD